MSDPLSCSVTFLTRRLRTVLRRCARRSCLSTGEQVHAVIVTTGLAYARYSFLLNALLHFYVSCNASMSARYLFDEIPQLKKDVADWTALFSCLCHHANKPIEAFSVFKQMRMDQLHSDDVLLVSVFSLCSQVGELGMGSQTHGYMVRLGLAHSVKACNALMNMYIKSGLLDDARKVFTGMEERSVVSWTLMVDTLVRCGFVDEGREVFDTMPERNEIAWTLMISGYVAHGRTQEGLLLLEEAVMGLGIQLNHITLCTFLSACAQSGDVEMGKWVHVYALKVMGRDMDIMVGTSLVDMYAKCGRINKALATFYHLPRRNVVAWNAMLCGLAMHGRGKQVMDMFQTMRKDVIPDDVTFMAVLSACSHSALVDEGRAMFDLLASEYNITPKIEHYACIVDILGRAGFVDAAEKVIRKMPYPPNAVVLGSLIGSCGAHWRLELGEKIMKELVEMDPNNTEYHVLLSNMYAIAGKQSMSKNLREDLRSKGIRKLPGISFIYVAGQVHCFTAGDQEHPQSVDIYRELDDVLKKLRLAGYTPKTTFQVSVGLDGVSAPDHQSEEIEQAVFTHSEKLALAFGLISTTPRADLYIFKTLRICMDCHTAMKIASKVYSREIVIRDRYRFHRFMNGSCSCSDYW